MIPRVLVFDESDVTVDQSVSPPRARADGVLLASASLEVRLADGTEKHGSLYCRHRLLPPEARRELAARLRDLAELIDSSL